MKKLYVGNLPYSAAEEGLSNLFSQFGTVTSVVLIKDRETGKAKGFGFVEFATEDSANAALQLDGSEFGGRALKISIARDKPAGAPMGGGFGGQRRPNNNNGGPRRW